MDRELPQGEVGAEISILSPLRSVKLPRMRRLLLIHWLTVVTLGVIWPHPAVWAYSSRIEVSDASVNIFIEDRDFELDETALVAWVARASEIVARYYGRFPVNDAHIAIRGREGRGVMHGRTFGQPGAVINVDVGLATTEADLHGDWILIHELIHLAFPGMPRRHHWIEEGLSVYVESVARANAGELSAEAVWREFVKGMPHGLPAQGDRGLDFTPTWGRTYWGGAMFCLYADIEIRRRTNNRKTLRDGLRAIVAAGYNITRRASLEPMLAIVDAAVGVPVLTELYERSRAHPGDWDLAVLWSDLGVELNGALVRLVDDAPLASIRAAITARDRRVRARE